MVLVLCRITLCEMHIWYIYDMYLVRGAITIVKNDGVRQWLVDDIPYMKWKIIQMFETTNQVYYMHSIWCFRTGDWLVHWVGSADPSPSSSKPGRNPWRIQWFLICTMGYELIELLENSWKNQWIHMIIYWGSKKLMKTEPLEKSSHESFGWLYHPGELRKSQKNILVDPVELN